MNGEPLPVEHGFPLRLVTPGIYGYVGSTKWLTEIELTRFDAFDQYWVPRGYDALAPIKTQARIDTPRGLATVDPGTVPIAGVAWAQTRGIERVEVRVDDGDWQEAELAPAVGDATWVPWRLALRRDARPAHRDRPRDGRRRRDPDRGADVGGAERGLRAGTPRSSPSATRSGHRPDGHRDAKPPGRRGEPGARGHLRPR
jgi:hypothetical protein